MFSSTIKSCRTYWSTKKEATRESKSQRGTTAMQEEITKLKVDLEKANKKLAEKLNKGKQKQMDAPFFEKFFFHH
jgi:hypothetical protein